MSLTHKSEMGMKIKYKLISHLYGDHKVRGCDCIQKVAETGMGLRRGTHFQEGESHKTTTCLAHGIPSSGQHPNKRDGGFTIGMLYESKSRKGRK